MSFLDFQYFWYFYAEFWFLSKNIFLVVHSFNASTRRLSRLSFFFTVLRFGIAPLIFENLKLNLISAFNLMAVDNFECHFVKQYTSCLFFYRHILVVVIVEFEQNRRTHPPEQYRFSTIPKRPTYICVFWNPVFVYQSAINQKDRQVDAIESALALPYWV